MNNTRTATIEYLQSTKGVIGAVDMLKTAISGGDTAEIDLASELLVSSTDSYSGNTSKYERFGFDALAIPGLETADRERVKEDLLANALVDLEVANVLIIAGRVAGESGETIQIQELDDARQQLEDVTNVVALPMSKAAPASAGQARFGFDEVPQAHTMEASIDAKSAKEKFALQSEALFDSLSAETKKVIQETTSSLNGLDSDKLNEALGLVGQTFKSLPQIGKLISRGIELVNQAMEKLTKLIGAENLGLVKDKAKEIAERIKSGDLLDDFLAYSFGRKNTSKYIQEKLEKSVTGQAKIDEGTKQLADLQTRFAERLALAQRIIKLEKNAYAQVVAVCQAVALIPGLNLQIPATTIPTATLVFVASCLVAIGFAVLTGMDFADGSKVFVFVPGLIEVTDATL